MEIFQTYFNKYRYSINGPLGTIYISEPIGWNEDSKTFKRSKEVHGVFSSLSNNLEFYIGDSENNGGYNYLKKIYKEYSINTNVFLLKEENVLGKWTECYKGYFDFSTYNQNENTISIMFNESGLYEKIKARNSEEIEIDRLTTMEGLALEPLKVESLQMDGRKIMIIDEFNRTNDNLPEITIGSGSRVIKILNEAYSSTISFNTIESFSNIAIPISMKIEQSGNSQTVYKYDFQPSPETANMFYADSPNKKTLNINIEINFSVSNVLNLGTNLRIVIFKFKDGLLYNPKENLILLEAENIKNNDIFNLNEVIGIELLKGESLALSLYPYRLNGPAKLNVNLKKCNLTVYDETSFEPTVAKFIMPFEALDRIINIITNKPNRLVSNALGRTDISYKEDGFASLTGLTNGFWVRQFNTEKITTSFQDFIDSFKCVWQLGYGIEKVGFEEKIRVEHISHFYRDEVTIKLGKVNNISRKCAKEYFYSSINVGYSQPSGTVLYEEALGLNEYNVLNTYTTPITKIENKLQNVSKYRADSYGTEFARRKPKNKYPEEDTRYDLSVMILDLKRASSNLFEQRKWADDFVVPDIFTKETTGIYSPETATNLRFSPINVLKRLGYWIRGGFNKDLNSYVRYSSSNGNSKLKTLQNIPGSVETAENGNILCGDLDKNLFNPETIAFEKEVDTTLINKVTGSIVINGETIMNYYGLVEFINEDGYYEYGYLISLEPNNEGKWELLSSSKLMSKYSDSNDYSKNIDKPNLSIESYSITN